MNLRLSGPILTVNINILPMNIPTEEIVFTYESPCLLFDLTDKLFQLDKAFNILNSQQLAMPKPTSSKRSYRWLFIDPLGQKHILLRIEKEKKERNNQKQISAVIPPDQYNRIVNSRVESLDDIVSNIECNEYFSFEEILEDICMLFNKKIISVYSPDQIIMNNPTLLLRDNVDLAGYWEVYGDHLSNVWQKFVKFIAGGKCMGEFQKSRGRDCMNMFKLLEDLKLQNRRIQIKRNSQTNVDVSFTFNQADIQPHYYPVTQSYIANPKSRQKEIQELLNSKKQPSSQCGQDCKCIGYGYLPCPNITNKIQCQHHACNNAQIRLKSTLSCKYLADSNNPVISIPELKQTYESCYDLEEYLAYGIDLFTYKILYLLLPFKKIGGSVESNDVGKKHFIEKILMPEISVCKDLMKAVGKLAENYHWKDIEGRGWQHMARVLKGKIQRLNQMADLNIKAKYLSQTTNQSLPYPKVSYLKAYPKGIGVRNRRKVIKKGKLIGEFYGQILQSWRQQQKQHLINQINTSKYKQKHIQFYCISASTHLDEPAGVRYFSVDPQNHGNFTRSLNHSCFPNCQAQVIISQGKYHLVFYANKDILPGEELTFDYFSVTDNYDEYLQSICLCGKHQCYGRYLKYCNNKLNNGTMLEVYPLRVRLLDIVFAITATTTQLKLNMKRQELAHYGIRINNDISKNKWLTNWAHTALLVINNKGSERLKEKILNLNNRITSILYYLSKCKEEYPLKVYSIVELLNYLTLFDALPMVNPPPSQVSIVKLMELSEQYRKRLLNKSRQMYKTDQQTARQLIRIAFTFTKICPTQYSSFESEPISIYIEGQVFEGKGKIYKSEDYAILRCLLDWDDLGQGQGEGQDHKQKGFSQVENLCEEGVDQLLYGVTLPDLSQLNQQTYAELQERLKQYHIAYANAILQK